MRVAHLIFMLCLVHLPVVAGDTWTEPFAGIRHLHRTGPSNLNLHAAVVDLCTPGVSVRHTAFHERQQRTSTFATSVGAQLAINGDFSCRPIDVIPNSDFPPCRGRPVYGTYGIAAHAGEPWPDTIYLDALLGFGHGRVQMYDNDEDQVFNPDWMSEVISGHGSIVRNGQLTIDDCPINPRTAIGLSQDHTQVMVAVVDGRNGWRGMTCLELGAVLIELGADRAFALDGGGSSTFWMEGQGVLNHPSDGSERVVGPHLAFFANGSGPSPFCEAPFDVVDSVSLPGVQPVGSPVGFVPVSPQRLFDTRHPTLSNGLSGLTRSTDGKVAAQTSFAFAGFAEAKAVALNVTAANPNGSGFVTAWPSHLPQPDVSTLNFVANQPVANLLGLPLGTDRSLSFYTHADVHLLGDLQGYFRDSGAGFVPSPPQRVLDTRSGMRIDAGSHMQIYPPNDDVSAVAMQVTTVSPAGQGFLTVFPCGQPVPDASHLNHRDGENRAAAILAKMGSQGICAFSYAETDLLVDVHGTFRAESGSWFQPVHPVRIMDTRQAQRRWHGRVNANEPVRIPFHHVPGLPLNADAVWLNLTAVSPVDDGFLSLVPCGVPVQTSVLNFKEERNTPANVLMGLDADGALCLHSSVRTHVLIDLFGYFVPVPSSPPPENDAGQGGAPGGDLDAGATEPDVATMTVEDGGSTPLDANHISTLDAAVADAWQAADGGSASSTADLDSGTQIASENSLGADAASSDEPPPQDPLFNNFACTHTNTNEPLWLWSSLASLLWFLPRRRRHALPSARQRVAPWLTGIVWYCAGACVSWSGSAGALSLQLQETQTPRPGLVLERYRTSNPGANVWVTRVDICSPRIWVDATTNPSALQTTGSWGSVRGVQAAINGDFYTLSPQLHVYGQAVGEGIPWPLRKTGVHDDYEDDWYYKKYGWVAFGPDWVKYTYTRWVKRQDDLFPSLSGHRPNQVDPPLPAGTLALISGFPTLVVEGAPITCSSPTASTCFPDRSDMRDRHPRSAVGISADQKTLFLVVVDGRTSQSSGMYGTELASLMHQLGAFFALNVDGGGSSQMWLSGQGYVNDRVGNNGGNGTRSVANHLGVFAGAAGGMPFRPGHCHESPPCQALSPEGGVIDDDSSCFHTFGPEAYWRVENAGHGNSLHWTNASTAAQPTNWAWWQIFPSEAGIYEVEFWAEPGFAIFSNAHYQIRHAGRSDDVFMNQQSAGGWRSLGQFDFASGDQQWVAIYDDTTDEIPAGQHIAADAIRLRRIMETVNIDAGSPVVEPPMHDAGSGSSPLDDDATEPEEEEPEDAGTPDSTHDASGPGWPPSVSVDAGTPPYVDGIAYPDGGMAPDAEAVGFLADSGDAGPAFEPGKMSCQSFHPFHAGWGLAFAFLFYRRRRRRSESN